MFQIKSFIIKERNADSIVLLILRLQHRIRQESRTKSISKSSYYATFLNVQ